jgi:hypothetical protein
VLVELVKVVEHEVIHPLEFDMRLSTVADSKYAMSVLVAFAIFPTFSAQYLAESFFFE